MEEAGELRRRLGLGLAKKKNNISDALSCSNLSLQPTVDILGEAVLIIAVGDERGWPWPGDSIFCMFLQKVLAHILACI